MTTVGIPRALLYYQYYPMWKTFFEHMGAKVVVSEPTTRQTLVEGAARVVADTCLPAKVFIGHVRSLVDRCDCVFIPAVRSLKAKTYNCSKFLGLPDMTRAVVPESPPILEVEIDVNMGTGRLYRDIYSVGRRFSWNPVTVRNAATAAWQTFQEHRETMASRGITPIQAIAELDGDTPSTPGSALATPAPRATIGLIGHAYLLYDEHTNYQLASRLRQLDARVVTPEMVPTPALEAAVTRMVGQAYWTYENDVVGAGGHYLEGGNDGFLDVGRSSVVDGVIGVMAFGCGPDSLMMDMVHRRASQLQKAPFMCLTLEEHTSETGVITRLEAFLDMIDRRKRSRAAVCA